jgi:HK97 family phage major capsid protein
MAIETKELLEKLSEIGDQVKHVQEKQTKYDSEKDALDFANIEKNIAEASVKFEELQAEQRKTEASLTEEKERVAGLERAIAAGSNGKEGIADEHKQAMYDYMRTGAVIPIDTIKVICSGIAEKGLVNCGIEKQTAYVKALVEGSNPAGGFFVTPDRSTQIVSRIFETSPIRSIASVVTTASDSIELIIDDDETTNETVGEVEARAVTDSAEIGLLTIPVHEISAKPEATQRMLDDAGFDIEGWHQGKVSRDIGRKENTWGVTGDGSKKWKGFLAYDAWTTPGTYQRDALEQYTSTGTSALLDESDDFIELQNKLIEEYQMGAVWTMRRATWGSTIKLKDGEGQYLMNPFMMKEGTDKILLQKPVVIMADMPAVAASSLSVAYGDFRMGYTIVDRFGIRVLRDPFSHKPFIQFYTTKRSGGALTSYEAIKVMVTKV